MEYKPAPRAVVGGRNMLPRDAAKPAPNPIARGPPIFRNLSPGAQTATVDSPPTIPDVYLKMEFFKKMLTTTISQNLMKKIYRAARRRRGPPKMHNGAITAPIRAE